VRQAHNGGSEQLERRGLFAGLADPRPFGPVARREARDLAGGRPGLLEPGKLGLDALSSIEGPIPVGCPARTGQLREVSERIA